MKHAAFALLMLLMAGAFTFLGIWQIERLSWKRNLIEQTERKLAQDPVAAPGPSEWGHIGPADLYTKIQVTGRYMDDKDVLVLASTRYGRGYWVITPMQTDGFIILVNRGFITSAQKDSVKTPDHPVAVTGLLRLTEPEGNVLQRNDPSQNRWFSRDVAAISASRGLARDSVAPYFVDESAYPSEESPLPVPGLTVVHFRNNHLQYALTWFSLAALSFAAMFYILLTAYRSKTNISA